MVFTGATRKNCYLMSTQSAESRDYTKFFTPMEIGDRMAKLLAPQDGQVILEPSAGNGMLVAAVKRRCPGAFVFAYEIDKNHEWSLKHRTQRTNADVVVIKDFLQSPDSPKYSGCIANPPFGNGTDLRAHFDKIRKVVKIGGIIVMIVPEDFDPRVQHQEYALENWSNNSDGTTTAIKIIAFLNTELI